MLYTPSRTDRRFGAVKLVDYGDLRASAKLRRTWRISLLETSCVCCSKSRVKRPVITGPMWAKTMRNRSGDTAICATQNPGSDGALNRHCGQQRQGC